MPRSSHPLNHFRDPNPNDRPWFVGRMPTASGGRLVDFRAGYGQDGQAALQSADRGALQDSDDPFFYLCVFGSTISMSQNDMHECVDEMVYTRQRKRRENPRQIANAEELKQKVADLVDAVKDAQVGRKRFAV